MPSKSSEPSKLRMVFSLAMNSLPKLSFHYNIFIKDLDFIISNKVTHIINCAGKQIINSFESFGVKYLTLNWMENDSQVHNLKYN